MKKNHEVRVKLSKAEHDKLRKKAEQTGLDISSFVRFLITKVQLDIRVSANTP